MALASNLVLNRLQIEEGFRGDIYDDATGERIVAGYTVKGNPTTGYGFALNKNPLSKQQGLSILLDKLLEDEKWCVQNLDYWGALGTVRQSAILDIVYQMGGDNWLGFSKANFYLSHGDYNNAYHEIIASDYARKFPNRATLNATIVLDGGASSNLTS